MYDEIFKPAYEESNNLLNSLANGGNKIPTTKEIIAYIEKKCNCNIMIGQCSFSNINQNLKDYGAMMKTETKSGNQRTADIILNSDHEDRFQIFSLVHELGYLVTQQEKMFNGNAKFKLSTHINYNITSIPKEIIKNNPNLQEEQAANIFALRVLMPSGLFFKKVRELDSFSKVAKFFAVSEEAVISRIMLVY